MKKKTTDNKKYRGLGGGGEISWTAGRTPKKRYEKRSAKEERKTHIEEGIACKKNARFETKTPVLTN